MAKPAEQKTADNSTRIVVQGVLSYPHLFKAQKAEGGGEPKFGCTVVMNKEKYAKEIAKVREIIATLTKERFKGKSLPPDKLCLKDGGMKPDTEGYSEDDVFLTTSNTKAPQCVGRNPSNPVTDADDLLYGGATVNVCVRLWVQDNDYGKRINASLDSVQFVGHGTRFGAAPVDPTEVFGEIPDGPDDI
jgi:hypothetical protein